MRISDWSSDVCSSDLSTVRDHLDPEEQPSPTDVADIGVVAESRFQGTPQFAAAQANLLQQPVVPDHMLHRQGGRAGRRVTHVGVSMLEEAAAVADRGIDARVHQDGTDRLVAGAEALGDHQQVRRDPVRSEEHTSELQSLMRLSYAVFCLKKK